MSDQNDTTTENDQNTVDTLPDWAREKLTKANNEAAKYRTEKNEAVQKAVEETTATFQDKVSALEAQLQEKDGEIQSGRTEVEKLRATIQAGIPNDKVFTFADLLKGESEEDFVSHAEELKKLFVQEDNKPKNSPAVDPSQGHTSDTMALNGDPLLRSVMSIINK